jgi:hypothetical protein
MVMVSHKHAFIFLKSRKTAGTSIEMSLEPLCGTPRAETIEATPARVSRQGVIGRRVLGRPKHIKLLQKLGIGLVPNWHNHMTAAEIKAALGTERWNRYRKITSVRNPFDRAVSSFHWQESRAGVPADEDFAAVRARFNDWVARTKPNSDKDVLFLDGAFVCDLAIRFEHLAADLQTIYSMFDPKAGPVQLYHVKDAGPRRKRPVPEYFTETSIATVLEHSGWVFERFGYPDRPQERVRAPAAPAA